MKNIAIIINPTAGKGNGEKIGRLVIGELERRGIAPEIHVTSAPLDATEFARNTLREILVVVGGDGTVNEVVNGIVGSGKTLAIIPGGSGNDLIKSLGLPAQPRLAIDRLFLGSVRKIDLGTILCTKSSERNDPRYFVNGAGIGFDAAVANQTRQIQALTGLPLYLMAVFKTLGQYKAPLFEITTDSGFSNSRKLLIAVGNGVCAGGGFYLTPNAKIDDGKLDICMIDDLGVCQTLMIMPKVLKGKHLQSSSVVSLTSKKIEIQSESQFYAHADGEMVGRLCNRVSIGIEQGALRVIT